METIITQFDNHEDAYFWAEQLGLVVIMSSLTDGKIILIVTSTREALDRARNALTSSSTTHSRGDDE